MPLRRYLSLLVLACLAPLLALAAWFAIDRVIHAERDQDRQLIGVAAELAADVDRELESRIRGLQILAESPIETASDDYSRLYQSALAYRKVFGTEVILADAGDHDKPAAFGLQGMRERARAQGGTLRIGALRSGGTVLQVSIPAAA